MHRLTKQLQKFKTSEVKRKRLSTGSNQRVESIIEELTGPGAATAGVHLPEDDIVWLCHQTRESLLAEPMLLDIKAPIKVVGDLHGQYGDLLRHFERCGYPPQTSYLFLGDYVDRGKQSIETICLLFAFRMRYPDEVYLLRGNHESATLNRIYGFFDECKRRYTIKLWRTFVDCYNCLPVAATIEHRIFCCHGGISPMLFTLDQIRRLKRPCEIPEYGLLCDLLWSDPDARVLGWSTNTRGVSVTFGADSVQRFIERHNFNLICRAHQVVEDGYEFFAKRQLVTIFSAPNYCGTFDNAGAIMCIDQNLVCSFTILRPIMPHRSSKRLSAEIHNKL